MRLEHLLSGAKISFGGIFCATLEVFKVYIGISLEKNTVIVIKKRKAGATNRNWLYPPTDL